MTPEKFTEALTTLVERAEYAGRQDGIAIRTRSNREAKSCYEMRDVSRAYIEKVLVPELIRTYILALTTTP